MRCLPASPPSSRRPLRRRPRFGRSFGHIPFRILFGSPQAQQLAAALDPAPLCPISSAIGNPPPYNLWQAGQFAEHSQNRPALLYPAVSKRGFFRLIISFLLNSGLIGPAKDSMLSVRI